MSDNLPAELPPTDLSPEDVKRIEAYALAGSPGFSLEDEILMRKMIEMYLSGKTYSQIARITRKQKDLVMYASHRLGWYELKIQYLQELENNIKGRVVLAKIQSQDFLLQLTQMWQQKIGRRMDRYLETGNEDEANAISLKEIDKYLKTVEALQKLSSDITIKNSGNDKPAVGFNIGDGVTVAKKEDGTVEITPKVQSVGTLLARLAEERRQNEANKTPTSDIKEVSSNKQGEKANVKK